MGIVVEIVGIHNFVEIAGECLSHRGISTQYLRDLIAVIPLMIIISPSRRGYLIRNLCDKQPGFDSKSHSSL